MKFIAIVVAGLLVSACSGPSSPQPEDPGETVTTTDASGVAIGLVGVEVEVSNAVAPFDHQSWVDSVLLEVSLARLRNQQVFDCLAGEGFTPPAASPLPDRDDPALWSNAMFPNIEVLARDGFPVLPGTPGSLDDSLERSEEEAEAARRCVAEVDGSDAGVSVAYDLWASVRGPWEAVLGEIDATDEIRGLVGQFVSCVRDEGIPVEFANSEGQFGTAEVRYLGYVQSLEIAAGGDLDQVAEIYERMGKLYVECGRELFEARERLRGGERREAFLRQHEVAVRELSELLYGGASP